MYKDSKSFKITVIEKNFRLQETHQTSRQWHVIQELSNIRQPVIPILPAF